MRGTVVPQTFDVCFRHMLPQQRVSESVTFPRLYGPTIYHETTMFLFLISR